VYSGLVASGVDPHTHSQDAQHQRTHQYHPLHPHQHLTDFPSQSASGISFKSQFLYLVVYTTRYLDLFWTDPTKNLWNTFFKIVFIAAQSYIVYLMLVDFKPTHDPNQDTFKVEYLLGGAMVMGVVLPPRYQVTEVCCAILRLCERFAVVRVR